MKIQKYSKSFLARKLLQNLKEYPILFVFQYNSISTADLKFLRALNNGIQLRIIPKTVQKLLFNINHTSFISGTSICFLCGHDINILTAFQKEIENKKIFSNSFILLGFFLSPFSQNTKTPLQYEYYSQGDIHLLNNTLIEKVSTLLSVSSKASTDCVKILSNQSQKILFNLNSTQMQLLNIIDCISKRESNSG